MNILIISCIAGFVLMGWGFVWGVVLQWRNCAHPCFYKPSIMPDVLGGLGLLLWAWPMAWVVLDFASWGEK